VKADVSYDNAGNVTQVQLTRDKPCPARCPALYNYQWDELGRLAGGSRSDAIPGLGPPQVVATVSYIYDGDGARVLKSLGPAKFLAQLTFSVDIFDTLRLKGTSFDAATGDYLQDARSERVYLSSPAGTLGVALLHAPDAPSGTAGRTRVFLVLPDSSDRPPSLLSLRPRFASPPCHPIGLVDCDELSPGCAALAKPSRLIQRLVSVLLKGSGQFFRNRLPSQRKLGTKTTAEATGPRCAGCCLGCSAARGVRCEG
jgi:hypothetical protein